MAGYLGAEDWTDIAHITGLQAALDAKLAITARPATPVVVIWDDPNWEYKGATITSRPSELATGDILLFVGDEPLPEWAAINDLHASGA